MKKTCIKCVQVKPLTDFHKRAVAKDGHTAKCKSCAAAYCQLPEVKERRRGQGHRRSPEAMERRKATAKLWYTRYYKTPKGKEIIKGIMLRRNYGLSLKEFHEMLKAQKGLCAICGLPERNGKTLCVDHCHKSNVVRGLLCNICNRAIGLFSENPNTLKAAADYLLRAGCAG